MKHCKTRIVSTLLALSITTISAETLREESLAAYNNRMKWFAEAQYGMFIHFGVFSHLGGEWKVVACGTTTGAEKEITFAPVKARSVRINVTKAEHPININEFQIFGPAR